MDLLRLGVTGRYQRALTDYLLGYLIGGAIAFGIILFAKKHSPWK